MPRSFRPLFTISLLLSASLPALAASGPDRPSDPLAGIDLAAMERLDDRYGQRLPDGREVTFTVDPELQRYTDEMFDQYDVPAGAAVVLNSRTGRVLTLSQHRSRKDAADSPLVALDPSPPAASVFKVVTAAALVEQAKVPISRETCYHGGSSKLLAAHLEDSPRDTACASLTAALGRSINAIFAKLSDRLLDRGVIRRYAEAFRFNRELPFDLASRRSELELPDDRLELARTSAGFWHSHMSPLHGALIAQTIAQGGAMLRPYVVDRVEDGEGKLLHTGEPQYVGRPVTAETAAQLVEAMSTTVTRGTGRRAFHDKRGHPRLPGITVAGKTGTLTGRQPYRGYSWFVALAPAEEPEIAAAFLVVNTPKWRIKSTDAAAMVLQKYFELKGR